jgi:hypothetical protein
MPLLENSIGIVRMRQVLVPAEETVAEEDDIMVVVTQWCV